jgi:hypothetical protein
LREELFIKTVRVALTEQRWVVIIVGVMAVPVGMGESLLGGKGEVIIVGVMAITVGVGESLLGGGGGGIRVAVTVDAGEQCAMSPEEQRGHT